MQANILTNHIVCTHLIITLKYLAFLWHITSNWFLIFIMNWKKDYTTDENEDATISLIEWRIYSKTLDDAGDGPSSHNQNSVIFIFKPDDGKKLIYRGCWSECN